MSRALLWLMAGLLTVSITALTSVPAVWLVPLIDRQSEGRFSLADVEGSLWQGSAVIGAAAARDEALAPLLPGRCAWKISPLVLLGVIDIRIENAAVAPAPITIRGSWVSLEIGSGSLSLPADGLSALGAPFNTIQPAGIMRASWPALKVGLQGREWQIDGRVQIDLTQMVSALSPVKPLGAYRMRIDWQGGAAKLDLQSLSGPLLLTGKGEIVRGALRFSGQAVAQEGEEARLTALLNLLGQRRQVGNRNIVALEFQ
jgi:general secretion pathway protein N